MKKLCLTLLLMGVVLGLAAREVLALAVPEPPSEFFVADFAQVLTAETEALIFTQSRDLAATTGAQIVVVTVTDLEGQDIESFATALFRQWQIGAQEKDSGLLILLAINDRRLRVEVGYGLEGILPDGKVGRFSDTYLTPYLAQDDWNQAVLQGYQIFNAEIVAHLDEVGQVVAADNEEFWGELVAVFIIWGVLIAIIWQFHKRQPPRGHVRLPPIFSSSGGSWGGGGFSGGGGSSGGGGASRSF